LKIKEGGEPPALGDFLKFVTKIMHFMHISAKIQLKNLKQHFDWGEGGGPPCYALGSKTLSGLANIRFRSNVFSSKCSGSMVKRCGSTAASP